MSEVLAFKMATGQDVVAEVTDTTYEGAGLLVENINSKKVASYTIRRPHILQFQPMGGGQLGLAFVPWTLANPDIQKMEIPASAVLLTYEPSENVRRQYISQTSGIELAPPGTVIR